MQTCNPESVGLSTRRLARIDAAMGRRIDCGELAGAITAVWRRGKLAHFRCHGLMDVEAKRPMTPDALFRIYSMSKPVTAAALLMLYEEGRFHLDEPVAAYIPEFASARVLERMTDAGPELADLKRPITIRHLFTHTSGLGYPAAEGTPAERLLSEVLGGPARGLQLPLAEALPHVLRAPLAHQPGEGWTYGLSIDVLGLLAEVISGKPFDEFLEGRLFGPLGMAETGFFVPKEKHGRLGPVYARQADGMMQRVDWATNAFWSKPKMLSGGGGLVSTADDYLRFARMLLEGGALDGVRVLSRRTVRLMASCHIPQLADLPKIRDGSAFGQGCTFGLGGRVVADDSMGLFGSVGSYGWDGLASTSFWVDWKEELIGLLLPQMIPGPGGIREQFQALVYQALE